MTTNCRVLTEPREIEQARREAETDFVSRLAVYGLGVLPATAAKWWPRDESVRAQMGNRHAGIFDGAPMPKRANR